MSVSPSPSVPRGVVAGLLAGALIGALDGAHAAWAAQLDWRGAFATVLLGAAVDAVLGAALGSLVTQLLSARAWAQGIPVRRGRRLVAALVAGLVPGIVAAQTVVLTASRVNRFLAALVVVLAALIAGVAASALVPVFAAVLSRGRHAPAPEVTEAAAAEEASRRHAVGLRSLPAAIVFAWLVELVVFFVVWRTRAPLRRAALQERLLLAGAVAGTLPLVVTLAGLVSLAIPRTAAALVSAGLVLAPLVVVGAARWESDLRFLPWADVRALVALALVLAAMMVVLDRRGAPGGSLRRRVGFAVVGCALALATTLEVASSEAARKALAQHAGLAGPLLAQAGRALDFDRDGYARLLGGGDCDDGDPARNPAALDEPDDGIDQDCDGRDASLAALSSPPFHPVPDAVPGALNIVFITIDTLRADHLGCYGYGRPTSPELDRLAAEGVLFENGWAHAPSTRYSMPAILTSRWPSAIEWQDCLGCDSWWPRVAPSQRTLGEAMKAGGYTTAAFWAYGYFGKGWARGFERGIDVYQDHLAALHVNVGGPAESVGSSARQMSDAAIQFLDGHKDEKFFLWLHYYDPHLNYEKHPEVPDFGSDRMGGYDGEIRFTDLQIGRVLERLRALGVWDRTAVVVTGDHGEGLGERGIDAHGYHLYPPQTKVPFIARVPGIAPRRVRTPVGHVDLAPTLVNLARGAHEPSFYGRSMVDLMTGRPSGTPPGPVFQEVSYEGDNKKRAFVTETHQLVWNWTPHNTTECYALADGLEGPDLWGRAKGEPSCSQLKADVRARVALFALPPGYRDKLAFGRLRAADAPAPAVAADARIGDVLRYRGYDLKLPPDAAAGGEIEVVYHFDVLATPPPGWGLFTHLAGPGGYRNMDHVPVEGALPLERWRPGDRIRDRQVFRLGPGAVTGSYTLWLGLWHRSQGRKPITPAEAGDAEQRLRAVTFEVR